MRRGLGLAVRDKPDSQDICFVEGGDYRDVLTRAGASLGDAGDVVTMQGERVGAHVGIANYTVGPAAEACRRRTSTTGRAT